MQGVIRKRDVVAHPVVTIQCFGWKLFFRTLIADHDRTFLELVGEQAFADRGFHAPNLVVRSAELERRAMQIYRGLARRSAGDPALRAFFDRLADQEGSHAELIELCGSATTADQWTPQELEKWQSVLPGLEGAMSGFEQLAGHVDGRHDSLQLMLRLESSEINDVFNGVVGASSSAFVRALKAFRSAEVDQEDYIQRTLPFLDASLPAPSPHEAA